MSTSLDQLKAWMAANEDEHLEFKEAKNNFHFEKLVKYCVALANEGGGRIILGITDKRPREVVGTTVFPELERTKAGIIERLRLRVEVEEVPHPDGRVLVFAVPSRPLGLPIEYEGAYWMRAGEDLKPMTPDMLKQIFNEVGTDFSAEICPPAKLSDLDPKAIEEFRKRWLRKSGNSTLQQMTHEQLLADAELLTSGRITFAALVLLGTRQSLTRYLPQAEVVFEYRSKEVAGAAQQRKEYREGFFLFDDDLWNTINLRNDKQHFQDGLFILDIPTFSEAAVREAILNAVSHREYRLEGSCFVRQFPRKLEIVSPGGFPLGITQENVLWRQAPRNRRIAEALAKCGLVERAGQGFDRIYEESIRQSKPLPDFTGTDNYQVSVTLHGDIQDPQFLNFLEKVSKERNYTFTTHDLLVLDLVHREREIPEQLRLRRNILIDNGIVETVGRGRGTRHILSHQFYGFLGKKGIYTRRRGLDWGENKELLLKHLRDNATTGSPLSELRQVLPSQSESMVQRLLDDLRSEGRVELRGARRWARWYPAASKAQTGGAGL